MGMGTGSKVPVSIPITILLCFTVWLVSLVTATPISFETARGQSEIAITQSPRFLPPIKYLGRVDGKIFFVEANLTKNWTDAKSHCEASHLQLASIESKNEVDLLKETLTPYGIYNRYWTSAHQSRHASIMEWGSTGIQPDTSYLPRWYWLVMPYQYCGAFVLWEPDYRVDMDLLPCGNEYFILCQKISLGNQNVLV